MNVQTLELPLRQFAAGGADWPEQALRSVAGPQACFTELASLPGTSVLVAAPRDHVFCSLPSSSFSRGRGHFQVPGQGAWQDWLDSQFLRPGVEREVAAEMRSAGLRAAQVRYGCLPYVGSTAAVAKDLGYSPRLPPLAPWWFRTYLIPPGPSAREQFVRALQSLFEERGAFALRPVSDGRIRVELDTHFDDNDVRDEALLWSFHTPPSGCSGREGEALQRRAIELLEGAVQDAERGSLPDWSALSPAFGDWSAKVVLADVRPQTITVLNAELISSYRVRLMRLTGWPVFCDLLKQVPARVLQRMSDYEPRRRPLPYDMRADAEAAVAQTIAAYPSYVREPFDVLCSG